MVVMHIISWNVRGLGGFEKRREVSHMVREKNPFILCLQESKLYVVNDLVSKAIWNDNNVDFSYKPSCGASGGLITLWNRNEVKVWSSFNMEHVLGIQGQFVKTGKMGVIHPSTSSLMARISCGSVLGDATTS